MDAVKFIEEAKRMCNANISNCAERCKGGACPINLPGANYTPEERVKLVEEWSAAHPRKTRQSVFLEHYPNAKLNNKGIVDIWPCCVEKDRQNDRDCISTYCVECGEEFWTQEVE